MSILFKLSLGKIRDGQQNHVQNELKLVLCDVGHGKRAR